MNEEYKNDWWVAKTKLQDMLFHEYGPNYTIDILKECIKILQPYAEKEREKTHA